MDKIINEPVRILTEEELTYIHDDIYGSLDPSERQKLLNLLDSHRQLIAANAELSYQTMLRVKYEAFLRSVIRCRGNLEDEEDFEWFKQRMDSLKRAKEIFK